MLRENCQKLADRKHKLEEDVSKLLSDFSFETGIHVSSIRVVQERLAGYVVSPKEKPIVTDMFVKISLDTEDM